MKKNYLFLLASVVLGSMFLLSCDETELDLKPVIRLIAPRMGSV